MKRSNTAILAWSLFTTITIMAVISLAYYLAVGRFAEQNIYTLVGNLAWGLLPVEFVFLAVMIIARQPHNLIGWLLIGPALALAIGGSFSQYFGSFSSPPTAPSSAFLAAFWFNSWSWLLLIFPVLLILQLFPSGQPMTARWRWAVLYVLVVGLFFFIVIAFSESMSTQELDWTLENPVGFISSDWLKQTDTVFFFVGLLSSTLLSSAALIIRYRRTAMLERAQIKWLLYACMLFALIYLGSIQNNLQSSDWSWGTGLLYLFAPLTFMTIPAAIGIAILRYRLWDIDLIIRKTLQYALLTGILALVYYGSITLLQSISTAVFGLQSPVLVVISTLTIAALFNPLRTRTQAFIDRRFYRGKYDAEKALLAFAERARSKSDIDMLNQDLVETVSNTLNPERIGLWLRKSLHDQI